MRPVIATIPGRPIAKGRPRVSPHGGVFTPARTKEAEKHARACLKAECPEPLTGPLSLAVSFNFKYTQRWTKPDREAADNGWEPWDEGKPDLDNLLKLIKDAGNGVLWSDDSQVVEVEAVKVYSAEDTTTVNVFPAERR